MPVTIVEGAPKSRGEPGVRERRVAKGAKRHRGKRISVALLNNSDAGLAATERQFTSLLNEVGDDFDIALSRYRLETLRRSPEIEEAIKVSHRPAKALRADKPDALIVTGAEREVKNFEEESFWAEFADVVDFARDEAHAAYFSSVAAHAAVFRLDGIRARTLSRRRAGVFTVAATATHALVEGFDWNTLVPHSRASTIDEEELIASGYEILTRSPATGPDIFLKSGASLLAFSQGHLEYDADTLGKEFRRDLRAFAEGKRDNPPLPPQSYFMPHTEVQMMALAFKIERGSHADLGPSPRSRYSDPPPWRRSGLLFYRNWLTAVLARKSPQAHTPRRRPLRRIERPQKSELGSASLVMNLAISGA